MADPTLLVPRRELLLLALGAVLPGCVPQAQIVAQSPGNPFAGQRRFRLVELDTTAMFEVLDVRADTPQPERQAKLMRYGIGGLIGGFKHGVTGTFGSDATITEGKADPSMVSISPRAIVVKSGIYESAPGKIYRAASEVLLAVKFTAPDGSVDEIKVQSSTAPAGIFFATPADRLERDGVKCGQSAAEYLKSRIG